MAKVRVTVEVVDGVRRVDLPTVQPDWDTFRSSDNTVEAEVPAEYLKGGHLDEAAIRQMYRGQSAVDNAGLSGRLAKVGGRPF